MEPAARQSMFVTSLQKNQNRPRLKKTAKSGQPQVSTALGLCRLASSIDAIIISISI
jgi:hypothetical protein